MTTKDTTHTLEFLPTELLMFDLEYVSKQMIENGKAEVILSEKAGFFLSPKIDTTVWRYRYRTAGSKDYADALTMSVIDAMQMLQAELERRNALVN